MTYTVSDNKSLQHQVQSAMDAQELKQAKTERRTAKSAFTRAEITLIHQISKERSIEEVREALRTKY
mgnify:CR=1 FL=1